jgi:trans-aconitate methyltransferase
MSNLTSILSQLEQERTRLTSQVERLNRALDAKRSRQQTHRQNYLGCGSGRIAAAQRARWAKSKGRKVVSISANKGKMSPAARRRIAAAQKARWAKWRKEKNA